MQAESKLETWQASLSTAVADQAQSIGELKVSMQHTTKLEYLGTEQAAMTSTSNHITQKMRRASRLRFPRRTQKSPKTGKRLTWRLINSRTMHFLLNGNVTGLITSGGSCSGSKMSNGTIDPRAMEIPDFSAKVETQGSS